MSDISKQQQAAVAAHQNSQQQQQQQSAAQTHSQMQQQVDGPTIQVQITHDASDQMHSQGNQVAFSSPAMNSSSTRVRTSSQQTLPPQQAMQNLQSPPALAPIHSQAGSTTITTMSTGPQQMNDWPGHGRVQVIQQSLQNPTYIQPVYNAQGQLIVPGNLTLHPSNMNQPIQVIAAGKAFQPGQMPHMLTTAQGKPLVQGQTASFPGYATIPTSGSNQTLVISQLGVLGQTNILPPQQSKSQDIPKVMSKNNATNNNNMKASQTQQQSVSIGNLVSSQSQGITTQAQAIIQPQILSPIQYTCNTQQQRTVPQGTTQTMQFAPWQATFGPTGLPQGLTWTPGTIQSSALLAQGSQIFIRNPQPEQGGMFIHNTQPSTMSQHTQMSGQQVNKSTQGMDIGNNTQSKTSISKTFSAILPNSIGSQPLRSSTGVSTQTTQTGGSQTNFQALKAGTKIRAKTMCRMPTIPSTQKTDAANQTKAATSVQVIQPKLVLTPQTCSLTPDGKFIRPCQNMQASSQQTSSQSQPLSQIQQMQSIFPDSVDQKPQTGQLVMSNGISNNGDRVMPVVSMPPGQMTSIMGNMIVQAVPGIGTMTPSITIPTGQSVQVPQDILGTPSSGATGTSIKRESPEQKEGKSVENGLSGARVGRLGKLVNDASSGPGESKAAAGSKGEEKSSKGKVMEKLEGGKKEEDNKENKNLDKKPSEKDLGQQKATMMVKPQVLTHVIEGFVIQESSEPFPVNRGCADGLMRKMPPGEGGDNGEPPVKKPMVDGKEKELATCETCGKKDLKSKFKKSKRFCSLSCAKRFNVGCSSRVSLFSREGEKSNSGGGTEANEAAVENPPAAAEAAENQNSANQENENKVNPLQWTVAEVCEFIRNLPGCAEYVDDFALQDIDGEALMLLKPDHLMSVMSMKLGPAVKIIAKIDTMRNVETNPAA